MFISTYIVPPPIELMINNGFIQLREPIIYPHGIILYYEIVAMQNSSEPSILACLNTSTLNVSTSMLLDNLVTGTFLVNFKVCGVVSYVTYM